MFDIFFQLGHIWLSTKMVNEALSPQFTVNLMIISFSQRSYQISVTLPFIFLSQNPSL